MKLGKIFLMLSHQYYYNTIMKRLFFVMVALFSEGLLCACSSDGVFSDDGTLQPGDYVLIYSDGYGETRAVYDPISYQTAPEWIKSIIDGKGVDYYHLCLFQGEKNGELIYFISADTDSTMGSFYDKYGERLAMEKKSYSEFFAETNNWKLIFFYKLILD